MNEDIRFPYCYNEIYDTCLRGRPDGNNSHLGFYCKRCGYYKNNVMTNLHCEKHGCLTFNKKCPFC